jgi:hypothetical protein
MQMLEIDYRSARPRLHQVLLAAGIGLLLAVPATSAQANTGQQTCQTASATGSVNSGSTASDANQCSLDHGRPAGGITGHKVG